MGSILPTIADVSSWQGDIAWGTTKGNLHFAILRVQDGTYLDPKLSRNVQSCESLGIPYYVYGFYRNGGAIEAARMVSRAKAAGASNVRGCILDVEVTGQSISGIKSAMATLNETGLDNGMYIANHLYGEYGGTDYGEKWRWIPTYGPNDGYAHTPPSHACELWQFTSEGRVPGVDGGVDCNALNGSRSLDSFVGEIQRPNNDGAAADSGADLITLLGNTLAGDYGNGEARKANLGGRYDEVQALVNHICTAQKSTLAAEVLNGTYGNGEQRKRALGTRYEEVQEEVNRQAGGFDVEAAAKAVIAGKYGDGQERKNRLGAHYEEVQKRVNELLN